MVCAWTCVLAAAIVGSMIVTMSAGKNSGVFKKFNASLNESQKEIYRKITTERLGIYLQGFFIGLLVAVVVLAYEFKGFKSKISKVCLFVVTAVIINNVYYHAVPKSTYMLNHLDNSEQVDLWLEIYKEMKMRNIVGLTLGVLAYAVTAFALM